VPLFLRICLSSIDKLVRYFDPDRFLRELATLWERGARNSSSSTGLST
jgi:hypothetical protein